MRSLSKIRNTLKNLPFIVKKSKVFFKKTKKLNNYQLSKVLSFSPKRSKKMTKHQILKNTLPLYDTVGISRSHMLTKAMQKRIMLKLQME